MEVREVEFTQCRKSFDEKPLHGRYAPVSSQLRILCSKILNFGLYFELPLSTEGGIAATLTIASQKYAVLSPFMKRSLSEDDIVMGFTADITCVIVWYGMTTVIINTAALRLIT
jgi:hypothetical protein